MQKPIKTKALASVTRINAGGWVTQIPEACELIINYRALPRDTPKKMENQVSKLLKKSLRSNFTCERILSEKGYLIDPAHKVVKVTRKAAAELGYKWRFEVAKGWLDAAFLTNTLNIPTVCIGSGTKGQAHVANEFEKIDNLVYGADAVLRSVNNFFSH